MAYEKTHDLLDLAIWMQSNREGVSLADIAQRFEVSRRTAERMRNLILQKFPQTEEFKDNNIKRWRIPQGTLRDFIQFSADELATIETARKLFKQNNLDDKLVMLNSLYDKIRANIKPDTYRKISPDAELLMEAEGIALRPGPRINIDANVLNKLKEAILSCKRILIMSQRANGELFSREVEPYGFLYGQKHYLVTYSSKKQKCYYIKMHEITKVEILDEYFERDKNFSIQKYIEKSFGIFQEEPFEVEWLFDKNVANDAEHFIFHPTQQMVKNKDGSLTVTFKAGGALEMDHHLYTWGDNVKVIKPVNFKDRFRTTKI